MKGNRVLIIRRAILFLAVLFSLGFRLQAQEAGAERKKAFPFELKDTLGRVVRLEDFNGKTLVMDFWFTGCKGCVQVAGMLHNEVIPLFKEDTSVVFIAVSIDVNFLTWKKSIRSGIYTAPPEQNLFTMGMGGDHPMFRHYGFSGCPQMLVINGDGYVVSTVLPVAGSDLVETIRASASKP